MKQSEIRVQTFESEDMWMLFRKPLFTSSRIHELAANVKREMTEGELIEQKKSNPTSKAKTIEDISILSTGAISYILELIQNTEAEPKLQFMNYEMEWGKENEGAAVLKLCEELGFSIHSDDVIYTSSGGFVFFYVKDICGGTPDVIFPDSIAEIKCPNSDTHLYYKLFVNAENFQKELPKYYDQIQFNMWLAKRPKAHFYSFDPRFKKESSQVHRIEILEDKPRQNFLLYKAQLAYDLKVKLLEKLT